MTGEDGLADGLIAGRYRLAERIGSGSMGEVWHARDELLDRPVAVKLLLPTGGLSAEATQQAAERAMREARITAKLRHPYAVAVHDVVQHDGRPCLIMEYVPSRSLAATLGESGPLPPDRVAAIGAQLAEALAAAHAVGIVHRDIKPGNVLLVDDGTAKITDFGISRATGDGTMTAPGLLMGTPAFLAPEVAAGGSSTFASDVFSLGATLYTAVEGRPPFGQQENTILLLRAVANGRIEAPERAGPLTPVLAELLHPDPARRPDMATAATTLAAVPPGPAEPALDPPTDPVPPQPANTQEIPRPRTGRRAVVIGVSAVVLVAIGALGGVLVGTTGSPQAGAIATRPPSSAATTTTNATATTGPNVDGVPRTAETRTVPPTQTTSSPAPTTTAPPPSGTSVPDSTTTSAAAPADSCVASYVITSTWPGGYQAEVTVHNASAGALSGWSVHWQLANGEHIHGVWDGSLSQSGTSVTVANARYNADVPSNSSTKFGFLGDHALTDNPGQPALSCQSP